MRYAKFIFFGLLMICGGCSSTPKVERVEVGDVIDLSGQWNDSDAMISAESMIDDLMEHSWLAVFEERHNRPPVVIVGGVLNQTSEHINTQILTKYLERELIHSGKVIFVASPQERQQMRDERDDQKLGFTEPSSRAKLGQETGADYMLTGSLNSETDQANRKSVVLYQVNLEMIDLETNTKVWVGQKQLKKFITRSRFSL
jgi:hypothetical protein